MKHFSPKIVCLALTFCALAAAPLFAETPSRYEKHEVYEYSDKSNVVQKTETEIPKSEEVASLEEIELPLRRLDYGVFKDDFDRLVAKDLRKDAKKLYEEQEKAKEISAVEEIELPITKWHESTAYNGAKRYSSGAYYGYDYYNCNEASGEPQKVVFYDGLGRKISDSLAKDAKKLYEKQQRANEWASWRSINLNGFWYGFWQLIKTVMYLVILIFAGTFVWRKIKESQDAKKKS